jgi:hypothetical protein
MPDEMIDRIRLNAAAARIALAEDAPARIARAVTPTISRWAQEGLAIPLEVEPSSFVVTQRKEIAGKEIAE